MCSRDACVIIKVQGYCNWLLLKMAACCKISIGSGPMMTSEIRDNFVKHSSIASSL